MSQDKKDPRLVERARMRAGDTGFDAHAVSARLPLRLVIASMT